MSKIYTTLLITGFLSLIFFVSCTEDNPTSETPPITPTPASNVVIIVDKNQANAVTAPCGTPDAVCATITDALFSAAALTTPGVPTILIRPGIYDHEPTSPIWIPVPVRLIAEEPDTVSIGPDIALRITAQDVTLQGLTILSETFAAIQIESPGQFMLNDIHVPQPRDMKYRRCTALSSPQGATIVIERSEFYGMVMVEGLLTMSDSASTVLCSNSSALAADIDRVNNSTFSGAVGVGGEPTATLEFTGNMVHGSLSLGNGRITVADNIVTEGLVVVAAPNLTLRNNLFDARDDSANRRHAMLVESSATIHLSGNRFDSQADGVNIIVCEDGVRLTTDRTNRLLNPHCWIVCDDLPLTPLAEFF